MVVIDWREHYRNPRWREWYPLVAQEVQRILAERPSDPVSTANLVALLYPTVAIGAVHSAVREKLYQAVEALSEHQLSDYAMRGPPESRRRRNAQGGWYRKTVRPLLWRLPARCPTCGQAIHKERETDDN